MEHDKKNNAGPKKKSGNHGYTCIIRGSCPSKGLSELLCHTLVVKEPRGSINMKKLLQTFIVNKKTVHDLH